MASTEGKTLIFPELIVAAGLKYLIGVSPRCLMLMYGVNIPSAYCLIEMLLEPVDKSNNKSIILVFTCHHWIACYRDMLRIGIVCLRVTVSFANLLDA